MAKFTGTQGLIGECIINEKDHIWKVSKRYDFTCESEYIVGTTLAKSKVGQLPHFMKTVGLTRLNNKIAVISKKINGTSFSRLVNKSITSEKPISALKQILIALDIAYKETNFTHYDLHIGNIIITKTDDEYYRYIYDDYDETIKTFNTCPTIIDYGFSYINSNQSLLTSCFFSNLGYNVFRPDNTADVRLLLCSFANEVEARKKPCLKLIRLAEKIRTLTEDIPCTKSTGWLKNNEDYYKKILKAFIPNSKIQKTSAFKLYIDRVVDIIQALISLPLTKPEPVEILFKTHYMKFYSQWLYVEQVIRNPIAELQMLKLLVSSIIFKTPQPSLPSEIDIDQLIINLYGMATKIQEILYEIPPVIESEFMKPLNVYNYLFDQEKFDSDPFKKIFNLTS